MTVEKYKELLAADFEDVETSSLTDISKVRIGRKQPVEKGRQRYLEKAGNPYLVRVGNIKVKVRFADNGISLEDSYGYRPNKSALDVIGTARNRCFRMKWVIGFDIVGLFDNINHEESGAGKPFYALYI